FAVWSGLFSFWENEDRLRLRLRPLSTKKPDQTRLLNTRGHWLGDNVACLSSLLCVVVDVAFTCSGAKCMHMDTGIGWGLKRLRLWAKCWCIWSEDAVVGPNERVCHPLLGLPTTFGVARW
ncbi:hypothetical protein K443DRAFT_98422, partial [Laccaria amethystina LaAM-08-1]